MPALAQQRVLLEFVAGAGFTGIAVSLMGRNHPLGIIAGGIILAISYVGGEGAQTSIGLPNAATGIFQAMMLFFLLATDILINYRLSFGGEASSSGAPS